MTNLDASPYVGRLALCRVRNGTIRAGQPIAWCRADGTIEQATVTELYVTEALDRVEAEEAGPGEIIAVAGMPGGDDRRDARRPRRPAAAAGDHRRRALAVDHRSASTPRRWPGRTAAKLTARQIRDRLDQELVGNVSIRVHDTERPDAWEVQGRGELQLVVLLEMMRREGFELTVGQPQVADPRDRRQAPRAGRAAGDRRPRGLRRRRHPAAGPAQGPHGADGQPRDRLGAPGVPGPGPRPDRLSHRVPDRDPRHRPAAPRLRALGAVGGRAAHAADRRAGRRPPRHHRELRALRPPGARARCSSGPARRSTRA